MTRWHNHRVCFRKFLGASSGLKVKTHLTLCKIDPDCQKKKHLQGCKYGNGHWPTLQETQCSRSTGHRAPGLPGYRQHSVCRSVCCSWEHSSPTVRVWQNYWGGSWCSTTHHIHRKVVHIGDTSSALKYCCHYTYETFPLTTWEKSQTMYCNVLQSTLYTQLKEQNC